MSRVGSAKRARLAKFRPLHICCAPGFSIVGELELAQLKQLQLYLNCEQSGLARLKAHTVEHKKYSFPVLQFEINATLHCLCSRCMQCYPYSIQATVQYAIIDSASYERELAQEYEIIRTDELPDNNINFHQLLEQELIVNAPLTSMHDCG